MKKAAVCIAATVLLAAVTVLTRQSGPQQTDGGTPPLRFAYQNRVGSAIPIIAVRKGYFSAHGLEVSTLQFSSGPACAEALFTGAADIAAMGDTTAVIAAARGLPLRMVASHASGEQRHRIIASPQSGLRSINDLAGRRLGVKKGTSTYGGLLQLFARNGIRSDSVQIVNLDPSAMPEALAAGSIDAFAASEPTPSLGELQGGRELATLGGLDNSYPIMILARELIVRERTEDLRAFMQALRDAERSIAELPEAAVTAVAAATGLPENAARRAMQRHDYRLRLDDDIMASLSRTAAFLQHQGLIARIPDLQKIACASFIEPVPDSP